MPLPARPGASRYAPWRTARAAATAIFVPQVVQIELCWILETAFGLRHAEVASVLRALQSTPRWCNLPPTQPGVSQTA